MTQQRVLGDRYEVGNVLGFGGMAEVHHGRDVRLGRDVAIKVLRSDLARDPIFQTRFRREAQAAAALNHPSIVAVYDTGEDRTNGVTTPYIIMEYVEGRTLRDILKAEGPLDPQRAMTIVADMCAALDFSHRNGIIHRDVKPGNVMISSAGRVKVMDFGIARAVSDSAATMTSTAAVIGTAQYLSPEQARGESVDARSDVYAVGCVLFELMTGGPPFVGDSPVAVAYQHVREDPTPPSRVNPRIPAYLDSIVLKALSKNPANRYQSAAEMRADLERALEGRKVEATPLMSEAEATSFIAPAQPSSGYGPPPTRLPPDEDEFDDYDDEEQRKRRNKLIGFGVLAAVLIAAIVTVLLLNSGNGTNGTDDGITPVMANVPVLTGLTELAAKAELEKAKLVLGTVTQEASTAEQKGLVIKQDPASNSKLEEGKKVNIVVGGGPNLVAIPPVKGLAQADAEAAIAAAGLVPAAQELDNAAPAGTVVDVSPASGQKVEEGSTVTISISTGLVPLPNVIGKTEADARTLLSQAGFNNVQVNYEESSDGIPGNVVEQDPRGSETEKVDPNTQVTLIVVKAPPATSSSAPSSSTGPPITLGPGNG